MSGPEFETSLLGRVITAAITRDDLPPEGVLYKIHTAYLKAGEPVVLAEKFDLITSLLKHDDSAKVFKEAPKYAEAYVTNLGQIWELVP